MRSLALALAVALAVANAVPAVWGAWRWWTVEPDRAFWLLLRGAQVVTGIVAVAAGVLYLAGFEPADDLFWLYVLLPVAVSFFGEQIRLASAQSVLDARGLEDAQAVGRLDQAGQRSVVLAILRRELGVMAISAGVIAFLAVRALGEI